MNYTAVRNRYLDDTVATASPATLLTMLYDRLVLDLRRGEDAQRAGDRTSANAQLEHAQDIITELASTLDVTAWDGARQLMSVYAYLLRELIGANVSGDPERTAACRELVEPLREAWHEAAGELSGVGAATLEPVGAVPAAVTIGLGELGVG
jgi:flagellar protein FliS